MPNWNDLVKRAADAAQREGLLGTASDHSSHILPPAGTARMSGGAAERVAKEVLEGIRPGRTDAFPQGSTVESPMLARGAIGPDVATERSAAQIDPTDVVQEQLNALEEWARDNLRASRRDAWRFWAFKLPAIGSSASVAAFEAFGYGKVVIVLGVITALCVGIDALFPGGQLHNVHRRAANEARRLQHTVLSKWRHAQLDSAKTSATGAAQAILGTIQDERNRIDKYVTDAEASLGQDRSDGGRGKP